VGQDSQRVLLMSLVAAVVILGINVLAVRGMVLQAGSEHYSSVMGTVLRSEVEARSSDSRRKYWFKIQYAYTVRWHRGGAPRLPGDHRPPRADGRPRVP
jgi:hypothetical protein